MIVVRVVRDIGEPLQPASRRVSTKVLELTTNIVNCGHNRNLRRVIVPNPRSGCQHKAWGVSPRYRRENNEARGAGDRRIMRLCRPLRGLIINWWLVIPGAYAPGFMLSCATRTAEIADLITSHPATQSHHSTPDTPNATTQSARCRLSTSNRERLAARTSPSD